MGIYTSKPVTDKDSCDEEFDFLKCGSSSMQGWRTAQEDAHNAILHYDENACFFAVYDGHGGHEVAQYTAMKFPAFLLQSEAYKKGDFKQALTDGFLEFDAKLLEPEVLAQLKKMAGNKDGDDCESTDSEDPMEIDTLKKEADMPIDEVLASHYGEKGPISKLKDEGTSTGVSPKLRPKRGNLISSKDAIEFVGAAEDSKNSNSSASDSSSSISKESDSVDGQMSSTKSSLSKNVSDESSEIKSETNGNSDSSKKEILVNGKLEKNESTNKPDSEVISKTAKVEMNGEADAADIADSNGDATAELVIEGKKILPPGSLEKEGSVEQPAYTGKGKSGGKGGKVKGASAITTTTHSSEAATALSSKKSERALRKTLADAKRKVLSSEDLDSEDDEEEDDATFQLNEGGASDDEDDCANDEDSSEDSDAEADQVEDEVEDEDEDDEDDDDDDDDEEDGPSSEDAAIYNEFYTNMKDGPGFDSGCTACVALLLRDRLYVANVGDSRCVVSRAGQAVDMSLDHKPEDDIEQDRITKAGGKVTEDGRVNGGLNLSRALGDHGYKQNESISAAEQMISPLPDVKELKLTKEDEFVIIACDGIWNSMTSQEAVEFVSNCLKQKPDIPLSTICEKMFEACLAPNLEGDGTGCDNMTCIIFSFKDKSSFSEQGDSSASPARAEVSDLSSKDKEVSSKLNGSAAREKTKSTGDESQDTDRIVCEEESDVANKDKIEKCGAVKRAAEDAAVSPDDRPGKKAKVDAEQVV